MVGSDGGIVCLGIKYGRHNKPFTRNHPGGDRTSLSGTCTQRLQSGNNGEHACRRVDHRLHHRGLWNHECNGASNIRFRSTVYLRFRVH